ncbi:MAG: hypothetical protein LBJ15_16305 [Comamonas sp.]|jgi:hypothetical protein|uniref:hypothetical protein n=1 Tax=Comamonas sp. TaxID=34028 RepID=UPI0028246C44|nr:hypothetical protein [Comamonas sp.]MDR0215545.1 hypothetical protein [Comamonas sp.]
MMRTWADFFPDVLPGVELGTPEPTVVHQLRRAAQEFCQRTRAWRTLLPPITTEEGDAIYNIPLPEHSALVRLEGGELQGYGPLALWRPGEGRGQYLLTQDTRTVALHRATAPGMSLVLDVTLKPSDMALGIDDMVFEQYSEVIARGGLARLRGDQLLRAQFISDCDSINVAVWRGRAAVRPRAQPYF